MKRLSLRWLFVFGLYSLGQNSSYADDLVNFGKDIQPLFTQKCVSCHGPDKQRNSLRLDTAAGLKEGGDSGPLFVSGKSKESRLVHAITGQNDMAIMPPKEPRLTEAEIAKISAWIDQGANLPEVETQGDDKKNHWSFQPIQRVAVPTVALQKWVRNPIDSFILARLEKEGLQPSPQADRVTLLRRLSLDLTGLPPTPEEIDSFVKDTSPNAYEKQVDRLLASPHYGERWGRHWLDLARYADSNGYSIDSPRSIWPYRDWVIQAINRDLPFDQFTIEQLAGDLLPQATKDQQIATGFHRNTQINEEGGIDLEQFRVEAVVDRVNTTGTVWLGLTVGCCQCHNHKFDPLSQKEYYQLFAFFNNQDDEDFYLEPPDPNTPKGKKSKEDTRKKTLVLKECKTPRETHLLVGGDFTRKGVPVESNVPSVLPPLRKKGAGLFNRYDLARWLVAEENPLTARVTINRIWSQYFGLGLVETVNDFGTQGTPPSHPDLLDWLATEFMRQKWSQKAMHKLIVTSATYRQASDSRPDLLTVDPRNRLLARQTRIRLEAETVRDVCLASSGLLERKIGGPSVFPPQPDGVGQMTQVNRKWETSVGSNRYRRGMYTHFQRSAPHPALTAFDAPDAGTTCTRRNRSNTPLQALTLLNDEGFTEYAYGLAARLLDNPQQVEEDTDRLTQAFRLCLGREPTTHEKERLLTFLHKQKRHYRAYPKQAEKLLWGGGPAGLKLAEIPQISDDQKAAYVLLARVLLNLDEFITRE